VRATPRDTLRERVERSDAASRSSIRMFGIRCNAIAFGLINTRLTQAKEKGDFIQVEGQKIALGIPGKMTAAASGFEGIPLRRQGEPHEAAGAMLFLASSLSSYVSGHTLEVTGGAGI